jgi:uncharacterized Zn finger protein
MMNEQKLPEINEAAIRQHATKQSFERGMDYYATGTVGSVVRRGDMVLAEVVGSQYEPYHVEIQYENLIDEAIQALGQYPYYDTVEKVVDAAIETHPDWCIQACKAQAEPIMDQGKSKHYHHAARWLEKAKTAYMAAGCEDDWHAYLDALLDKHARKYKLVPMLEPLR